MILVDLDRCYQCGKCSRISPEFLENIERAVRTAVCLHCEDPPCVKACPEEALVPGPDRLVRKPMVCISCKQCSLACPVGANPHLILGYERYSESGYDIKRIIRVCTNRAVSESDELPDGWRKITEDIAVRTETAL